MSKFKKIITNWRVIVSILAILMAIFTIAPNPNNTGVIIRSVELNSSAHLAGIESPERAATPMSLERITHINNIEIKDESDYYSVISTLQPGIGFTIRTTKRLYEVVPKPIYDEQDNETVIVGIEDIGLSIKNAPTSNIRFGLELEGGTRVLLEPKEEISDARMDNLIANLEERINVYGQLDITLSKAGDPFTGAQYLLIEIAGATDEEVRQLLLEQGVFEAKVGNKTVYYGSEVTNVDTTAMGSRIETCFAVEGGEVCRFIFSITLSPEAARAMADVTRNMSVVTIDDEGRPIPDSEQYLNETLDLYLDGALTSSLNINKDLQGKERRDIAIRGSRAGNSRQEAIANANREMRRMQAILSTGTLDVELEIVTTTTISPTLGREFINNAVLVGLIAIFGVSIIIFLRYKRLAISIPILITTLVEVTLLLGIVAFIGRQLDLASMAGILIAVGTGVDHQILITDETLSGEKGKYVSGVKNKIKKAFFIVMAAYVTTVVAMIPLLFAGAGLLTGFALMTILGVTMGVFITRPAYAAVIEELLKE